MQLSDRFPIFPDFRQGDAMLGTPLGELRVFACYPSEFAFGFFRSVFPPVDSSQGPSSQVITRIQAQGQVEGLDGVLVLPQDESGAAQAHPCLIERWIECQGLVEFAVGFPCFSPVEKGLALLEAGVVELGLGWFRVREVF